MDKEKLKKVAVLQYRSAIGRPKNQKRTLQALGLRRIGQRVQHTCTPPIAGMIAKVAHLVIVEDK